MNSASKQLGQLIDELHEVNAELTEAARPLRSLSDLDDDQRQRIGDEIRAGLARWESVSQCIARFWTDASASGRREKA